jgi:hypothetical protein
MTDPIIFQAIQTRYIGPSNTKGARIVARCAAKRIIVSRHRFDELSTEKAHQAVAKLLAKQLDWTGDMITGCLHDGSYAHVFSSFER